MGIAIMLTRCRGCGELDVMEAVEGQFYGRRVGLRYCAAAQWGDEEPGEYVVQDILNYVEVNHGD